MAQQRPNVLIIGGAASGKTRSMKSLSEHPEYAKGVLYVNVDAKGGSPIPRVKLGVAIHTLACPTQLPDVISQASQVKNPDGSVRFHTIIVDTITRLFDNYIAKFISSNVPMYSMDSNGNMLTNPDYISVTKAGKVDGMSGWQKMQNLWSAIQNAGNIGGVQMVYMSHMALNQMPDGTYKFVAPVSGGIGKAGLSSYFDVVVMTTSVKMDDLNNEADNPMLTKEESIPNTGFKHVFQVGHTKDSQDYPLRVPTDIFDAHVRFIDNDLYMLNQYLEDAYAD